jgi:acyl dehydratase
LEFTTENTAGLDLRVLPTFANIITRGARVDFGDIDWSKVVHAEQSFRLHTELPAEGRARSTARVVGVYDKGSGALVITEADAVSAASGKPLATTTQTVFIRGEGGFGGPRGNSEAWPVTDTTPEHEVCYATRPEQALLYRHTGDRNPLHTDPAFAARGGFPRPILHGMCTYGFTGRALLHTVCGSEPARLQAMRARFTKPVLPGDELTVSIWRDGPAGAYFRTTSGGEVVLDRGRLEIDPAP